MTERQKAFIHAFLRLEPKQREALLEIAIEMLENVKAQGTALEIPPPTVPGPAALGLPAIPLDAIEAEVARYRETLIAATNEREKGQAG